MLDYSVLRDIQKKEMESSAIVHLPEDFYQTVSELLAKKKEEAFSSQSLLAIKEYENIKKIIRSIAAKREEKIALMTVRGENGAEGLTTEEREMFKGLSSIIMDSREKVKNVWSKEESSSSNSLERRIKILKDVAQYRGIDNSLYGPFKEGEEQTLPSQEAEWLLKAGMAEAL
jgi:DNA replication initiation complex subunit (GINS family)